MDTIAGRNFIESGDCTVTENCFYLSQHQHVFSDNAFNNISIFGTYSDSDCIDNSDLPMYTRIRSESDCSVLSGGEKQILKLCRMLVQHKEILIMDEPFAGLDSTNSKMVFHLLSMRPETIILVSHTTDFEESDLRHWERIQIEDICYEEGI